MQARRYSLHYAAGLLRHVWSFIVDLIYPAECFVCQKSLGMDKVLSVCRKCYRNLPWILDVSCRQCGAYLAGSGQERGITCLRCQQSQRFFDEGFSALNFSKDVRELLWSYKYQGHIEWARLFAVALVRRRRSQLKKADILVTYVPLSLKRFYWRGFNQSFLVAFFVSRLIQKPLKKYLYRKRFEMSQVRLKAGRRNKNVVGAFEMKPNTDVPEGKTLLIIDDVMTTGATLNECARVLKKSKIKNIMIGSLFSVPGQKIKSKLRRHKDKEMKDSGTSSQSESLSK